MVVARILGSCVLRTGPSIAPTERLWICAVLDTDLVATGRCVVALGAASRTAGDLVGIGAIEDDPRGFDRAIQVLADDLGVCVAPRSAAGSRVWLRERPRSGSNAQPQNRH